MTSPSPLLPGLFLRRALLFVIFAVTLFICRWLAYQIRFDFNVPEPQETQIWQQWHWVVALQLICLGVAGQFSGIYRYFSLPDIQRLAYAMIVGGAMLYGARLLGLGYSPPRGVILLQALLGFLSLGAMRTAWRLYYERVHSRKREAPAHRRRVAIIGAGDAAASLIRELNAHPGLGLVPAAIFDDDPSKAHMQLHGVPVVGPVADVLRLQRDYEYEQVIIAMPSAAPARLAEVVGILQQARMPHVTVPGIHQMARGHVKLTQLRPVQIEDLLGREPVDLRTDEISGVLKDRVVMVTGAGGSIGGELCRQIASFHPAQLLLVDQSEVQLFLIEQELAQAGYDKIIVPVIADILDRPRMRSLLQRHKPAVIFHAAAHKHVSMMERQPSEAIKNNAYGTALLADMALKANVERFVMISTDKAVNPTNVMGASKRMAEVYLQALAKRHPGRTHFSAVRFGNVLGSSGSVVPIFEKQIAKGGPVTVTDPEVVRFFMTIPEAVGLVLQTCALGHGGEIFVLDMGQPVKIVDMARQMIRLSGFEPGRDIEIKYIGLRPGEKLYEELHHLTANCTDTAHPRIKRLTNEPEPLEKVQEQFHSFDGLLHSAKADVVKRAIKEMLPEYTPCYTEPEPELAPAPAATPGIEPEPTNTIHPLPALKPPLPSALLPAATPAATLPLIEAASVTTASMATPATTPGPAPTFGQGLDRSDQGESEDEEQPVAKTG